MGTVHGRGSSLHSVGMNQSGPSNQTAARKGRGAEVHDGENLLTPKSLFFFWLRQGQRSLLKQSPQAGPLCLSVSQLLTKLGASFKRRPWQEEATQTLRASIVMTEAGTSVTGFKVNSPCSVEWTTFDSMDLRMERGMMVKKNGILTERDK